MTPETEAKLQQIIVQTGAKTKSKAIRYLILNFEQQVKLAEAYHSIKQENDILCDINFVNKIVKKVEVSLSQYHKIDGKLFDVSYKQ